MAVYDFLQESGGTRVELTTYGEPATAVDRFKQLGAAGWMRRQTKKALERLRMIFEQPPQGGAQAGHDRRLRAGQGAPLRRPGRYGSLARDASINCAPSWLSASP